jgi:hypothetical protein
MKLGIFLTCLVLLTMGIVAAQNPANVNFTIDKPFVVGNATLPAGSYQIRGTDDQSVLECTAASGSPSVMFEVEPMEPNNPYAKTQVQFVSYGGKQVLKYIETAGSLQGFMSITTAAEKKHKKAAGGKGTKVAVPATK